MTEFVRDSDAILGQFRDWLNQTGEEIAVLAERSESDSITTSPQVGLLQLAEAFTALRHEIKLQTRGARNLEGVVEQSMAGLEAARREFRGVQAKDREAAERAVRPIVDALIGLDEGLLRAVHAFRKTGSRVTASTPVPMLVRMDLAFKALPWWKRVLNRRWYLKLCTEAANAVRQSVRPEMAGLMQGFEQLQLRSTQALLDLGIERIYESGGTVDPERMTVIEVVETAELPAETVLDVVRPGYTLNGRVIRFAEVRASIGVRAEIPMETSSPGLPTVETMPHVRHVDD